MQKQINKSSTKVVRSAITGQFEKREEAIRRPDTTVTETIKRPVPKKK
jgi:hypothetical protein